jgi:hypothetical protein
MIELIVSKVKIIHLNPNVADSIPLGTEAKNGKITKEGNGSRPGNMAWSHGGAVEVGQCDALSLLPFPLSPWFGFNPFASSAEEHGE